MRRVYMLKSNEVADLQIQCVNVLICQCANMPICQCANEVLGLLTTSSYMA